MTGPNPVVEASEIVAALASSIPTESDPGSTWCWFCHADTVEPDTFHIVDHDPDCLWVRARRLTRLPVHPHKVAAR